MTVNEAPWVIVVGAGPAGLLLSLLLSRSNIAVTLLEKNAEVDKQPRATHYGPPAMEVLNQAGLVDGMSRVGFYPDALTWRTIDNKTLTEIDHSGEDGQKDRMICLPLNQMSQLLLEKLEQEPSATILWNHEVVGQRQEDGRGVVDISTPTGRKKLSAPYIVGCDGANSKIRRLLFGDSEFPGKTWDAQVVATNVYYDFHKFGYKDCNFIIDPENWYMASRISRDGLWRVSYGASADDSKENLREGLADKWRKMLPGNPTPEDYKITNFSPYKVHQRLAKSMRVGSFILAADAAHLCNPFGGLGLTGGIVDVGGLFQCLDGIHKNKTSDAILDIYSDVRREKYEKFIDPISSENFIRMSEENPNDLVHTDDFFVLAEGARGNPGKIKEMIRGLHVIKYDFSKHFTDRT